MRKELGRYEGKRKKFYAIVDRIEITGTTMRILVINVRDINLNWITDHSWFIHQRMGGKAEAALIGSVVRLSGVVRKYERKKDGTEDYGLRKTVVDKIFWKGEYLKPEIAKYYWDSCPQEQQ